MLSQRLRHRVDLHELVVGEPDPLRNGARDESWQSMLDSNEAQTLVPAEVVFLSGREFTAAGATQAEATVRVTMRFRTDVDQTKQQRVVYRDEIGIEWNLQIVAVLPDPTLRQAINVMCRYGVNDG